MSRLNPNQIQLGDTVQVAGPTDREAYIRQTLERLRNEKITQAEAEVADILARAKAEAEALIAEAHQQAAGIVASGEDEKQQAYDEGVQQGHTQGYEDGYREGREQAEDDTETLLLSSNILIERAYQAQHQILDNFTPQAATILKAILEQALHTTLNQYTNQHWETLLTSILCELTESSQYRLVVSAEAYKQFKELSPRIAKAFDDGTRLVVDVDDQLAVHEMYVISDEGTVDISPGSQAEELLKAVIPQLNITEITPETINPDDETEQLNQIREGFFNQYQQRHLPPTEATDPNQNDNAPVNNAPQTAEPTTAPAPQPEEPLPPAPLPTMAPNESETPLPDPTNGPATTEANQAAPPPPALPPLPTAEPASDSSSALPDDPLGKIEAPQEALDFDGFGDIDL